MFLAPHHHDPQHAARARFVDEADLRRARWTWIAGTRFGGIRWL
jgi:hypothetical protein